MDIIIFLLVIGAGFVALMWITGKSKKRQDLAKRNRTRSESASDKLFTPADNVLSHRDEVWQKRRREARTDILRTNRYALRSESLSEPEYDGYSRRDRNHLTTKAVHVKDEEHDPAVITPGTQSVREEPATRH